MSLDSEALAAGDNSVATLRDALIRLGVSTADLDALDAWVPYRGLGLAERVYRSGLVGDARLVEAFAGLGAVDATNTVLGASPPPAALGAFTRALADRHRALPLSVERKRLVVALLDPSDTATLEKLSFTCGLVIEPRACRPRVLFEGLAGAYDIAVVRPEPAFLQSRQQKRPGGDDEGFNLPPPSTDAGANFIAPRVESNRFSKADTTSPMARMLAEAADRASGETSEQHTDDARSRHGTFGLLSTRPAREATRSSRLSATVLDELASYVEDPQARVADPLSTRVLRLLVPPLRCCALFIVKDNIAVGWDVRTANGHLETDVMRNVLVPLTADSVLATAAATRQAVVGHARDPSTMERTLFRLLRLPPPRSFVALPVVIDEAVSALLYADSDEGDAAGISALDLEDLRRVVAALGTALRPILRPATDR